MIVVILFLSFLYILMSFLAFLCTLSAYLLLDTVFSSNYINLLKPKTYCMYHQLQHSEILCSAHNAFLCFAWISEQTALISLYSIDL